MEPYSGESLEERLKEREFYEGLIAVLHRMPSQSTVADALATREGQRVRMKWMLKYGRQPPI